MNILSSLFNKPKTLKICQEPVKIKSEIKLHHLVDIMEKGGKLGLDVEFARDGCWNTWTLEFSNLILVLTKNMENNKCWYSKIKLTDKSKGLVLYESPSLKIIHTNYGNVLVSLRKDNLVNGLSINENDLGAHYITLYTKIQELYPSIHGYNKKIQSSVTNELSDRGQHCIEFTDSESEHY